ncbi:hypothetical protein [Desulfobacula toluolica]|uniref:hypothetical protein n=1 Tax=Desulfobacula toluolica TaxID=28223 RepID=UPI00130E3F61|nr:hypothetical protein [Desulfobacula toluolica]
MGFNYRLRSNPSAVTGDEDMGGSMLSNVFCPSPHVFVLHALNPRALARNKYPVGPPEAYCFSSFFCLILETRFNQYILQNYPNLTSFFELIKHPPLDAGIHMNTL